MKTNQSVCIDANKLIGCFIDNGKVTFVEKPIIEEDEESNDFNGRNACICDCVINLILKLYVKIKSFFCNGLSNRKISVNLECYLKTWNKYDKNTIGYVDFKSLVRDYKSKNMNQNVSILLDVNKMSSPFSQEYNDFVFGCLSQTDITKYFNEREPDLLSSESKDCHILKTFPHGMLSKSDIDLAVVNFPKWEFYKESVRDEMPSECAQAEILNEKHAAEVLFNACKEKSKVASNSAITILLDNNNNILWPRRIFTRVIKKCNEMLNEKWYKEMGKTCPLPRLICHFGGE